MRLRTLVTWIVVLLTGGNLLFSLTEPANVIYLPVWGTLSIGPPAALYLLVVAVVAVAGVRWYGPRTVRWRAAAAGVCLACLTFIQAMIGRGRFGVVEISPDAVLCNYTDFPASSALARTITADVRRAMSELQVVFTATELPLLRGCLFASTRQFYDVAGHVRAGARGAYNQWKRIIYVPLFQWNRVYRHELVHYFQHEAQARLGSRLLSLIPYNRYRFESLAAYLAPGSSAPGFRAVDYLNAIALDEGELRRVLRFEGGVGRPSDRHAPHVIESANILLATYTWYAADSPQQAIEWYFADGGGDRTPRFDPARYPRDTATEAYLRYAFAETFTVNGPVDPRFQSPEELVARADSLSPDERVALARWNRDRSPVLERRLDWEAVLDSLRGGRSVHRIRLIRDSAAAALRSDLRTQADLDTAIARLQRYLGESAAAGHRALAAYLYFYLVQLEHLSGAPSCSPPPPEVAGEYNLYYRDFIAEVCAAPLQGSAASVRGTARLPDTLPHQYTGS